MDKECRVLTAEEYKDLQKRLNQAMKVYNAHFVDEPCYLSFPSPPDPEQFIKDLYECLRTNTPYKYPDLPEGCIA